MQDLAMQHGALYLHVLQPHRYVRPDPSFVARDPADEALRDRVRDGYAAYRVHMNGVKVIDASQNFEETEKSLWATDCCHLSDIGNKRLREIVGKHISEFALNPKEN